MSTYKTMTKSNVDNLVHEVVLGPRSAAESLMGKEKREQNLEGE